MRKHALVVTLIIGLVAALATPTLARKKPAKRKYELTYTEPAVGTAGAGVCTQGSSCLFFGAPAGREKYFAVEVVDDLGTAVYASVIQDTNEDGNFLVADDLTVGICGATEEPIEIEPGKAISVWVWEGPGADPPCPGGASSGTATAFFSAKP